MSTSPYHAAGKLMNQILIQKKSIKTVAFSKSKLTCNKSTYATVCNTVQNKSNIDMILNQNGGKLRKAIEMDKARIPGMVYVLLYELLFGPYGNIRGGGKLKRMIMKHEKSLRMSKEELVKNGCSSDSKNGRRIPVFPRYVRVNKLKATTEEIVKVLKDELEKRNKNKGANADEASRCIYADPHVPDLIILSPKSTLPWHELDIVKEGKVVLQDKSSCFSALALAHGHHGDTVSEGDFIDACAAPGNKTSHLAALIYDQQQTKPLKSKNSKKTKVFAFDRSSARLSILKSRMSELTPLVTEESNPTSGKVSQKGNFPVEICPTHQDFLKADPNEKMFRNVKSILLDPSCSGSGIVNSPDRVADLNGGDNSNRIESLSNFQLVALKHAMTFPNVDRIVYSTCSVHQRENEDVVAAAMKETNEETEDEEKKWRLVLPRALMKWRRRGLKVKDLTEDESNCLIRVNGLDGDETNGFFVSYFERVGFKGDTDAEGPDSSLINVVDGVKTVYNGEFRPAAGTEKASSPSRKPKDEVGTKEISSIPETSGTKNSKDTKQIPKKAAKRLEWKRKQKEKKLERIRKQKAAKSEQNK